MCARGSVLLVRFNRICRGSCYIVCRFTEKFVKEPTAKVCCVAEKCPSLRSLHFSARGTWFVRVRNRRNSHSRFYKLDVIRHFTWFRFVCELRLLSALLCLLLLLLGSVPCFWGVSLSAESDKGLSRQSQ